MKQKSLIVMSMVVLFLALACGSAFLLLKSQQEKFYRSVCTSNMAAFSCAVKMYMLDNPGQLPPDVLASRGYNANSAIFKCPGSGNPPVESFDKMDGWGDYIFISWPEGARTPPDHPLMYDRRMSHHQGKGIFVMQVTNLLNTQKSTDGIFFDTDARWLQKFAKEHPELKIAMPEGLTERQ